jgi:LysR family transcriptional regulator, transcriptional activator of nhaA
VNYWLNYHHLFYFKAIAEEGSVSKAAQKLRLGQPTLSAQLKQFEEAIGVQLFERQHKKLVLTEQGKLALEYARGIFAMGSEMMEAVHDRLKPAKPHLAIGALDHVPKQAVLQLVKSALKFSPCQITLLEGRPDELLRELVGHRLDLFLTSSLPTGTDAKGLSHRLITRRPVAIFATPKFKELRKNFPRSVSGRPMIVPTYDSKLRYDLEHWAKIQGIELDVVVESQDITVKKLLAASGLGLLPTATHTVTKQVLSGDLVEIGKLEGIEEQLLLVSAARKISNPLAAELMKSFQI